MKSKTYIKLMWVSGLLFLSGTLAGQPPPRMLSEARIPDPSLLESTADQYVLAVIDFKGNFFHGRLSFAEPSPGMMIWALALPARPGEPKAYILLDPATGSWVQNTFVSGRNDLGESLRILKTEEDRLYAIAIVPFKDMETWYTDDGENWRIDDDDPNWFLKPGATLAFNNPVNSFGRGLLRVEKAGALERISIFPNPAGDLLEITLPVDTYRHYLIYNLNGKLVASGQINSSAEVISVRRLARGTYLLRLKGDGEADRTVRFLKM